MSESLGEAFPRLILHVEEILGFYENIGPPGAWAAANIATTLTKAQQAWKDQDTVAMIRLYPELQNIE